MTVEERRYRLPRREHPMGSGGRLVAEAPGLPAQALALVGLLYLAATDGGFFATDWYPVGLGVLALLAIWAPFVPPGAHRGRPELLSAVLLVLLAAWGLISIGWAGERSAAWDGANRALLYAALFALFALWRVGPREARWLVALAGLGIALLGVVELLRFAAAADPTEFMLDQRLSEPVGYQNGNVALWLMGAFCCLGLAAGRQSSPVTRALALGSVTLLASLALLGQSRGSLFALPAALLVFFVIAPGRLRLLAALLLAGSGVALAAGPVLDVIDAGDAALAAAVDDAARTMVLSALGVALVAALLAAADQAWRPSHSTSRRLTRAGAGLVVAVALAALVVGATQAGELRGELSERWSEFKSNDDTASGSARLVSGGTNRYDFWTVAWENFEREPLAGVGMDNFQQDYMARGESPEKPRYAHSLELAVLSGTGIVGMLLFLGALVAAAIAAIRVRRGSSPAAAGAQAAALGLFAYWFFHASVDWLYELPALGGLAFAMLGLACGIRDGGSDPAATSRVARILPAVLAAAAALSFAFPWLAEREVAKASASWRSSPAGAYERLARAADLNPTSVQADLFEGTIAVQRGELGRAERAFLEVVEREPRNSYAWLHLAALASARQDGELAGRRLARALELNPTDQATRDARQALQDGERILPEQVLRDVLKYARGGTE